VIADELVALSEVAADLVGPGGEALMECRAAGFGEPGVGGVADEEVPESVPSSPASVD
jgi:hypothetical protein